MCGVKGQRDEMPVVCLPLDPISKLERDRTSLLPTLKKKFVKHLFTDCQLCLLQPG